MNNNITVFINAIDKFNENDDFISQIPLGNNPSICVLIETLLEISSKIIIFTLISNKTLQKEIIRWFQHSFITIQYIESYDKLYESYNEYILNHNYDPILIMNCRYPLISNNIIKEFLEFHNDENISLLISKMDIPEDHYRIKIDDNSKLICIPPFSSNYLFNSLDFKCIHECFIINSNFKFKENNFLEMINGLDINNIRLHEIPLYIGRKELICIRNKDEYQYAEEIYTQKRNFIFINQCYNILQKCETFDKRLDLLEKKCINL